MIVAVCATFIAIAFYDITAFVDNSRRGLLLFGNNVLPVLFPFFFISSLLIELNLFKKRGARFGVVAMSFLSGYPTGARMLSELYARGQITRQQAIHTATYTSTASPIFVIATVGVALYGDVRLGVIIFASHVLGAVVNGLLYNHPALLRRAPLHKGGEPFPARTSSPPNGGVDARSADGVVSDAISRALYSSVQNILAVGGLIIIFFIAAAPFGLWGAAILEMTTAVFHASELGASGVWRAVIPCAIVSFGGLCVAMQGFVFLRAFGMPVWFYLLYKVTHAVFAVLICVFLVLIF